MKLSTLFSTIARMPGLFGSRSINASLTSRSLDSLLAFRFLNQGPRRYLSTATSSEEYLKTIRELAEKAKSEDLNTFASKSIAVDRALLNEERARISELPQCPEKLERKAMLKDLETISGNTEVDHVYRRAALTRLTESSSNFSSFTKRHYSTTSHPSSPDATLESYHDKEISRYRLANELLESVYTRLIHIEYKNKNLDAQHLPKDSLQETVAKLEELPDLRIHGLNIILDKLKNVSDDIRNDDIPALNYSSAELHTFLAITGGHAQRIIAERQRNLEQEQSHSSK